MKKLNKLVAILVAMAMVLALSVISAFADDTYYTAQPLNIDIEVVEGEALPTLTDVVTFTSSDDGAAQIAAINLDEDDFTKVTEDPADDTKDTWNYNVANVVPAASSFGHAGVFTYTIEQDLDVTAPVHDGATSVLNDDTAVYTMTVYVINGENGLEIQAVTLAKDGQKVNTTDDGEGQEPIGYENSYFEKLNDDDDFDDDDDTANDEYIITKTVTGDQADMTKTFEITATLTLANFEGQELKAFIRDANGDVVTDPERTVTITDGVVVGSIGDGEKIVVKGLPIGTAYSTEETDLAEGDEDGQYTATYTNETGSVEALGTTTGVENAINETTPEGILISNLPYIALALVAIGGLVAYVVVRRKADDEA